MKIERYYTHKIKDKEPLETDKPYENTHVWSLFQWSSYDSRIQNQDGGIVFEAKGIEIPTFWSQVAADILAQKYFRKAGIPVYTKPLHEPGIPEWLLPSIADEEALSQMPPEKRYVGEKSARQAFHRLAGCWTYWAYRYNYFSDEEDAVAFYEELCYILAAPNSCA